MTRSGESVTTRRNGHATPHQGGGAMRALLGTVPYRPGGSAERRPDDIAQLAELQAAMLEEVQSAVIAGDAEHRITSWNRAAEDLYGWTRDEAIGRPLDEILPPLDAAQAAHRQERRRRLRDGMRVLAETPVRRRDGRALRIFSSIVPRFDAEGCYLGWIGVGTDLGSQVEAQQALELQARLLSQVHHPIIASDPEGVISYWNRAAEQLFGWSAGEVAGHRFADVVPIPEGTFTEVLRVVTRGERWQREMELTRRDGSTLPVLAAVTAIHDEAGTITGLIGAVLDLTDHRRAQAELLVSEARFRQIASNIDAGLWLFDPASFRMEYLSPRYEALFGLTLDDFHRDPWCWLERLHPDDREWVRTAVAAAEQVDIQYRLLREDGEIRWIHGRTFPVIDDEGRTVSVAGSATDVTDEHEGRSRLEESEARFRQLAESIDAAFWLYDAVADRTIYMNPGYGRLFGASAAAALDQPRAFLDVVHPDDRPRVEATMAGDLGGHDVEYRVMDAGGAVRWIREQTFPIRAADGRLARVAGLATDMTEQRSVEAALARQVSERAEITQALLAVRGDGTVEDIARGLMRPMLAMDGVDITTAFAFENGSLAVTIAAEGPEGMPVGVGRPVPRSRAQLLRERAAEGVAIHPWRELVVDRDYGRAWTAIGLTAGAYLPLVYEGELLGMLVVGTTAAHGHDVLGQHLAALAEYSAVATALLGPRLRERRRTGDTHALLERVIAEHAFEPVFQPIVELATRTVVGYEALTRFKDGTPPDERFAEAETVGLGVWLEAAALAAVRRAAGRLPASQWLSVNVSPEMAADRGRLRRSLGTPTRELVVEVTETRPISDYRRVRRNIASLGSRVRLAVDDAGAGFASLRHIVELRPQFVKLDMGLVRGIDRDPARQALVAGMVHFASETSCALIAEGIETEAEQRTLRRLGVSLGQGYLLGRPLPIGELAPR